MSKTRRSELLKGQRIIPSLVIAALMILGYLSLGPRGEEKIIAFCGSASKPALEAAASAFERKTGIRVELQFGGSGAMLSRMEISGSGDLYIPGSPDYMAKAVEEGIVDEDSIRTLAYLVPAIIVPKGNPKGITELRDLAKAGVRVGIADPESVCIGEYAVELLKHNLLYDEVSKNIVVYAESCSKAGALVPIGAVDAVIGWDVFHRWNPDKADIVHIEPHAKIPRLAYIPAAISSYSKNVGGARQFLDFLSSQEGREYFENAGYLTTEGEARKYAPDAEVPSIRQLLEKI